MATKHYFALEHEDGRREFGCVEADSFDDAFMKIESKLGKILSIAASEADVSEDVYCQDNDC